MDYTINLTITDQSLSASNIVSVNGTVAIIGCTFDFDATWDAFPARQAIFKNSNDVGGYVAAIGPSGCLIPWEVLKKAGTVSMAIVGTNTDGQVQRTNTIMVVCQTRTLQGGVNSIDPTPDQYAQFIAQVEEMIGQAGVLTVNGMTGDVTLTASDVGALADTVAVPTRTSQLTNDSGFLSAIPAEYVTETELNGALATKANTADLATVATSGSYNDLTNKPTIPAVPVQSVNGKTGAVVLTASDVNALPSSTAIPSKTSDLTNDSGFLTSAVTSFNGSTGAVTYSAPVSSVNGQTGAVTTPLKNITRSDTTSTETATAGGTIDMIDSITTNGDGQVTAVNTKTVTLPQGGGGGSEWTQLCDVTTTEEAILQIPITGISIKEVRIYILQPASYSSTVVIYCPLNNPEGNHYDKGYGRLIMQLSASTASGGKAYMLSQLPVMIDNVAEEQQSDSGLYFGNAANMRMKFGNPSNVVAGQTFTSLSIATYQAIPAGLRIVAFGR